MATLEKSIRLKRFDVIDHNNEVTLTLETVKGEIVKLRMMNLSLNGFAAESFDLNGPELDADEIVNSSKIVIPHGEYALGRVVVKFKRKLEDKITYGMSLIDTKIPVESGLSKYLSLCDDNEDPFSFELDADKFNVGSFIETSFTNIDLFSRCRQFGLFLKNFRKNAKYNYHCLRKPSIGVRVNLSEKYSNNRNDYIMMGGNDYLGLSFHPKVLEDSQEAIRKYGFGSTGSHVLTGNCEVHDELCQELAGLYHKDQCILFNSGYAANLGAIQALTSENDFILADMLSHASLQDGMRMSAASFRFYLHNNMKHLKKLLNEKRSDYFGALILTQGVFSMDGDIAPLKKITNIAKEYNCRTLVDEAHGLGVLGERGLGAAEEAGILDTVDIIMGNTSKSLGSLGGFLCGDNDVMEWLKYFARSRFFSTSMPPVVAQAALSALRIMKEDPSLLTKLRENTKHFVQSMIQLGAPLDEHHRTAIVPIIIGDEKKLGIMNSYMKDSGVYVPPITYPGVSKNTCRFRFTLTAAHTISDIDYVVQVFKSAMAVANFSFESLDD